MKKLFFLAYLIFIAGTVEFITRPANASTFFAPDSDTALLFNLVSNTASQLNELEKLVTNAEKYTELMEKYNQIANDQFYRAERIHYIAQNYVELSRKDPQDLETLNSAIRSLKSETESLKSLIKEYRHDEARNEYQEGVLGEKLRKSNTELNFANHQVMRSGDINQVNDAQRMTAQNTSLIYKSGVESNQLSNSIAEKLTEQNKLLNRELKEESIKKEEREQYYNFSNKRHGRAGINGNTL